MAYSVNQEIEEKYIKDQDIRCDLVRLREAINKGYLPEEVYQNYIETLNEPYRSRWIKSHKAQVLIRLKEFAK